MNKRPPCAMCRTVSKRAGGDDRCARHLCDCKTLPLTLEFLAQMACGATRFDRHRCAAEGRISNRNQEAYRYWKTWTVLREPAGECYDTISAHHLRLPSYRGDHRTDHRAAVGLHTSHWRNLEAGAGLCGCLPIYLAINACQAHPLCRIGCIGGGSWLRQAVPLKAGDPLGPGSSFTQRVFGSA